jgi:hypothetical protein
MKLSQVLCSLTSQTETFLRVISPCSGRESPDNLPLWMPCGTRRHSPIVTSLQTETALRVISPPLLWQGASGHPMDALRNAPPFTTRRDALRNITESSSRDQNIMKLICHGSMKIGLTNYASTNRERSGGTIVPTKNKWLGEVHRSKDR